MGIGISEEWYTSSMDETKPPEPAEVSEKDPNLAVKEAKERLEAARERFISLARELVGRKEKFPFSAIDPNLYESAKKVEEEYPGYSLPIDVMIDRFKDEGFKVVLGEPLGTVLIMPFRSSDLYKSVLPLKYLLPTIDMDERLREIVLAQRKLVELDEKLREAVKVNKVIQSSRRMGLDGFAEN